MNTNKSRSVKVAQIVLWSIFLYGAAYFVFVRGVLTAPAIHQFEGEEQLSQSIPEADQRPYSFATSKVMGSKIYSLDLDLQYKTISPVPGTELTGRVTVTGNGMRVGSLPEKLWGKSGDYDTPSPRIYIKTYGILDVVCSAYDAHDCIPRGNFLRLTDSATPRETSEIYSEGARFVKDNQGAVWDEYIVADDGQVDFTIRYQGNRNAPYLLVEAYTDADHTLYARKLIKFEDQVSATLTQPDYHQDYGTQKYQVSFAPNQIKSGESQLVKVVVQAIDEAGEVATDNYQRVRISTAPLSFMSRYKDDRLVPQYRVPELWQAEYPGVFLNPAVLSGASADKTLPFEKMREALGNDGQDALLDNQDIYRPLLSPKAHTLETDLVAGKTEAYYWYSGVARLNSQLQFVVQPVDFNYEDSPYLQQSLNNTLPTRYADDLPGDPDAGDKLYGTWLPATNKLWESYTKTGLPLTDSPVPMASRLPDLKTLAWMFVALHLAQLLGSGLWLMTQKRQLARTQAPVVAPARIAPRAQRGVTLGLVGLMSLACMVGILAQSWSGVIYLPRKMTPATTDFRLLDRRADIKVPGKETDWRVDIAIDGDKINPQPGSLTTGRVRVTDKSGRTVPVTGAVAIRLHAQNRVGDGRIPVIGSDSRPYRDNIVRPWTVGRFVGTEPYSFIRVDLQGYDPDESAKEVGVNRVVLRPYFDSSLQATDYFGVGGSLDPTETGPFHNPYQNIVWIKDGVGQFGYINYAQGADRVMFEVSAYEMLSDKVVWAHATKFLGFEPGMFDDAGERIIMPGLPEDLFPFGSNQRGEIKDELQRSIDDYFASLEGETKELKDKSKTEVVDEILDSIDQNLPDIDQFFNLASRFSSSEFYSGESGYSPAEIIETAKEGFEAATSQLIAYGGIRTLETFRFNPTSGQSFTLPRQANSTKLPYYYEITTPRHKTLFAPNRELYIKVAPKALPGHQLPTGDTNHIKLSILPVAPPTGQEQYMGESADTKYPAGFVVPGQSGGATTIEFDMGAQEKFVRLRLTDDFPLNQHIQFELTAFGVSGYPEYLNYRNPTDVIGNRYDPNTRSLIPDDPTNIVRADNPEVMKITANMPVALPTWQNLWIYLWYPAMVLGQLFMLIYVLTKTARRRDGV